MLKKKIDKVNEILKNISKEKKASIVFTIATILNQGLNLLATPIYTRLLNTESFGKVSLFFSWTNIIAIIVTFNITTGGVLNNALLEYEEEKDSFIISVLALNTIMLGVFFGVYCIFKNFFENLLSLNFILISYMVFSLFCSGIIEIWTARERFSYQYKKIFIYSAFNGIISILLPILIIYSSNIDRVYVKIIGSGFFKSLVAIYLLYLFIKKSNLIQMKFWKYVLSFNIPLIPHYLSSIILSQSDRIMIGKFSGNSEVGIYTLAYSIGAVLSIFTGGINASFIPWTYRKLKAKNYLEIAQSANTLTIMMGIITIFSIIFSPNIVKILAPPEYYQAIYVIPPVSIGIYYSFIYTLFANIEFYHKKTKYVMYGSVLASLVNIGLNFAFIPLFGYIAAAYTTMVGYILLCIMHCYFYKKIETNRIYELKKIFGYSSFMSLIGLGCMLTFNNNLLRYIVIGIIFIILLILKKKNYLKINLLNKN